MRERCSGDQLNTETERGRLCSALLCDSHVWAAPLPLSSPSYLSPSLLWVPSVALPPPPLNQIRTKQSKPTHIQTALCPSTTNQQVDKNKRKKIPKHLYSFPQTPLCFFHFSELLSLPGSSRGLQWSLQILLSLTWLKVFISIIPKGSAKSY